MIGEARNPSDLVDSREPGGHPAVRIIFLREDLTQEQKRLARAKAKAFGRITDEVVSNRSPA